MQTWTRYTVLLIAIFISLHLTLQYTYQGYKESTSLSALGAQIGSKWNSVNVPSIVKPDTDATTDTTTTPTHEWATTPSDDVAAIPSDPLNPRANATFVILARNSDVHGTVASIKHLEERFNSRYNYPYVFLNEVPFSDDFKKAVSAVSNSIMEFGVIPKEDWYQPDWIDEDKARTARNKMARKKVIYGGSVPYRNMCRFNSGFFFKQKLLQKYRWYWRVEPNVNFHCDINFDPFVYMRDNDKVYGFTISLYEYVATIPTLWGHVQDFIKQHPQYVAKDNAMKFLSDDDGKSYNLCHFWSNFEIADMDFWRGEAYAAFFEYLDSQGGFYYERWGDAPVHSIAAALFLPKEKIHFFDEIGYEHAPFTHCPQSGALRTEANCGCGASFDYNGYSCLSHWQRASL